MINVDRKTVGDLSYRYQMPKVNIRFGGAGNGKYTIIENMDEIGLAINSPPEIIFKYISYSFGALFNDKNKSISGYYNNIEIQNKIYDYIDGFILCNTCSIPEVQYSLEKISAKKSNLTSRCSACGTANNIKSTKINDKCVESIIKYLTKEGSWVEANGNMVSQIII